MGTKWIKNDSAAILVELLVLLLLLLLLLLQLLLLLWKPWPEAETSSVAMIEATGQDGGREEGGAGGQTLQSALIGCAQYAPHAI